ALFLVERANDDLKLRIGKNTRQAKNSRSHAASSQGRKQKRVDRIRADRDVSAAISSRHGAARGPVASDWGSWATSRIWVIEWEISRTGRRSGSRGPARPKGTLAPHLERAEQPIEPKLFQIVLRDLDKLRFDLNLFWNRDVRLFN